MTWVVGAVSFGQGVLVSDVRVSAMRGRSFSDVDTLGIQKIHRVGDNMIVGFSGLVALGFRCVELLASFAATFDPPEPPRFLTLWKKAVEPRWDRVANGLSDELRTELLLLGVSRVRFLAPGVPVTSGYRIQLPYKDDRRLILRRITIKTQDATGTVVPSIDSIGSGSDPSAYGRVLADVGDTLRDVLVGVRDLGGDLGAVMALEVITAAMGDEHKPGVSLQLHASVVNAEGVFLTDNVSSDFAQQRAIPSDKRFPPTIATTGGEWRVLARRHQLAVGATLC